MQKQQSAPKQTRLGFTRLAGILAVTFIAAIIISALPTFSARAESNSSFASASLFGLNATEQAPLTAKSLAPLFAPNACDIGNNIEVEGTNSGNNAGYATLAAAFAAINAGTHTGTITIDVCGNTTEPATGAILNQNAGVTSITISPAGGAARTITGAATAGLPLVDFNGADMVTVNGLNTGGNSLTISNTTVSATSGTSTIRFQADATNNLITNASVLGSATMAVGTNGGNIIFGSAAITTGNDNNTISNCNLGPAGANLPSKVLGFSGSSNTDPGTANSGIVINNNNIFDYFSATVSTAGVDLNSGTVGTTISNNRFYQTATRTMTTTSLTHSGIRISNTSGNAYQITGNTIGFASNTGTGTYTIVATATSPIIPINLSVGTTTATSVQGNTVAGMAISGASSGTSSSGAFRGIYVASGLATVGDVTGNTVGSMSATGSITYTSSSTSASDVIAIFNFGSSNFTTNNNNVGGITASNSSTGASNIYGIRTNTGSTVTWICNNNTVGGTVANSINSTSTSTGTIVNGILNSNPIGTFIGNTIRNMTVAGGTGTTTTASMVGIVMNNTVNNTIGTNTIFNLSNTNATAATVVTGIQFSGSGTANVVERNFIHSLTTSTNSATAEVNGIRVGGGTTTYRNNMIAIGAGIANAIGGATTNGISGINEPSATGVDNFFHNSVYIGGSPTAGSGSSWAFNSAVTTSTRSFRNNIFFNGRSNSGATGKNYIVRVGGTTANPAGLTINNNVYFANGTGAVFGFFNGADVANLAAWKTAVGQDANSIEADPLYVAPAAATPDLHIQAGSPAIDQAANLGVTNDFDGESRPGANASFDIGADERDGIAPVVNDVQATAFIDPVNGGSKLAGASFSPVASFTNNGTANQPSVPVRYRIIDSSMLEVYNQTTTISLNSGVTANATFASISLPAGTYTIKARSELGTDTVPANDEITGTLNILAPLSGNYTVGSGGNFPTLTAAIASLNSLGISGPVTLTLTNAAYNTGAGETFPLTLNAVNGASSTNTITIKPNTGVSPTISGSSASCIFILNGTDWATIDGSNGGGSPAGTSRDMTITNTNAGASSAVVCIESLGAGAGATNNTVKNTNVVGATTTATAATLFGIFSGSTTISITSTGADNDNNTIQNNSITKTSHGIYSGGASAANKNTGTVITQNVMNAASPTNITTGGIVAKFEDGIQISRNDISVLKHDGTIGTTDTAFGIALGVIPSNTVTTFTGSDVTNASVTRNKINGVTQLNSTGYSAFGIVINSVTSGTTTLSNNMITGVRSASTASDFSAGILAGGGTGSITNIYHNSVAMTGTRGAATFPSYGLAINSGNPLVDVKNNIFYNTQTSSSTAKMYAIANASTTFTNMTSNYNDLYVSGTSAFVGQTGGLGTAGVDRATLADWNTATASDNPLNSKSADPGFTDPTSDLHITNASPAFDAGDPTVSVTVDFDGEPRPSGAAPDMGADEVQVVVTMPGTFQFNPTTYNPNEGDGMVTLTVTRTGGSDGAVDVSYTLADGTATGGASCGAGVDYVNTGGTVMFANGDASKTFTVPICEDAVVEGSEAFTVMLTGATNGGTIGANSTATVTIADNDVAPAGTIQFSATTYSVGEGGGNAMLTVTRTGGSNGAISATYSFANVTATGGAACGGSVDYVNTGSTVMFADGDTANKTILVPICDDAVVESSESFTASLSGAAVGSPSSATVTITDNETPQPGTVQFAQAFYTVGEGAGSVTLTVTRTGGSDGAISVTYNFLGITATGGGACGAGIDYAAVSGTLNWADGDSASKTFNVTICEDTLVEGNENFLSALNAPTGGATVGTQSSTDVTITDNDTPPTVQFSSSTYSTTETLTGGRQELGVTPGATITVTRTGNTSGTSSVNYATSDGTATGGATCGGAVDYKSTSGTLNFLANETSKTFFVETCPDTTPEPNETVNLTLSNPVLATLGTPNTAVLTINDNDPAPTASLQFGSATFEADEGDGTATITVTRTGDTSSSVTVNYATSNGTAASGTCGTMGVDYEAASGTLTFGSTVTSQTFTVNLCTDLFSENPPETVNLTLSSPSAGATIGSPNPAVLNIVDAATQYRNSNPIFIPENPVGDFVGQSQTTVTVAGAITNPNRVRVTLYGFTHPTPDDIDILLVSPSGQKFVLVGDAGGSNAANNLTLTFENAATNPLPDSAPLASGNFKPANHEAVPDFFAPAPTGPYSEPGSTGTGATLNGTFIGNPNGTWTFYFRDDTANGNVGSLSGGVGLEFLAPSAASVSISGRVTNAAGFGLSNVRVSLADAGSGGRRFAITSSFGYYTFEDVTVGQTYIISVSAKRHTFNPSVQVVSLLDSVTDLNFASEQ